MQLPISICILVVDDEEELVNLFRQFIISMGFDVVSFTNPIIALDHFKQLPNKYSMIITDLRMPGMSGIELGSKIREIKPVIKIVLATAFDIADIESNKAYKMAKIDMILQKPIKLSLLRKVIEQNLVIQTS